MQNKITLFKIENDNGVEYKVSADALDGEALATYNDISELYETETAYVTLTSNSLAITDHFAQQYSRTGMHTAESKAAIGSANSIYQQGEKNSQFGTQWIYSNKKKTSKKIRVTDKIPRGWKKGRKIKFED